MFYGYFKTVVVQFCFIFFNFIQMLGLISEAALSPQCLNITVFIFTRP